MREHQDTDDAVEQHVDEVAVPVCSERERDEAKDLGESTATVLRISRCVAKATLSSRKQSTLIMAQSTLIR